jgi:hypothetical protein
VSIKVLNAGERDTIRHAFVADLKSDHTGVFWRESNVRGKVWKVGKRMTLPSPKTGSKLRPFQLKIRELYGPRVPDVFDDPDIIEPVMANASIRMDARLKHHTDRMIAKAAAG